MAKQIISQRQSELLQEIAQGFENGTDRLLDLEWLTKNEVTIDEVFALGSLIATSIRAFISLGMDEQARAFVRGELEFGKR